jgi:hypothetical protein
MELVEKDTADARELGIAEQKAGKDAFGDKTEAGFSADFFVETDLVADRLSHRLVALRGYADGREAGGDATRFEDEDVTGDMGKQCGRDACGFASPRRGFKDEIRDAGERRQNFREDSVDGESLHVICQRNAGWTRYRLKL